MESNLKIASLVAFFAVTLLAVGQMSLAQRETQRKILAPPTTGDIGVATYGIRPNEFDAGIPVLAVDPKGDYANIKVDQGGRLKVKCINCKRPAAGKINNEFTEFLCTVGEDLKHLKCNR